jgi:phosphoglucan,water dikinase
VGGIETAQYMDSACFRCNHNVKVLHLVPAPCAGVKQVKAKMAVLIQEMLAPDLSFVLHSASPLGDAPGTAVAEVAAGLGETLASGARGSPWRLAVNKATGQVETLAFANFSAALLPAGSGSRSSSPGGSGGIMYRRSAELDGGVAVQEAVEAAVQDSAGALYECDTRTVDYSRVGLSASREAREALGQRLGAVAAMLEREFRGPQDVEGCCVGPDIYIVQSRPQPL